MKKRWLGIILLCLLCIVCSGGVSAQTAKDITGPAYLSVNGAMLDMNMQDNNEYSFGSIAAGQNVLIESETAMGGLYVKFWDKTCRWKIESDNSSAQCGQNGFLHEYVDLVSMLGEQDIHEITLIFAENVRISEIRILSVGEVPDEVQVWQSPCQKADLLLFSTHSDDEQLFFSGLLPYCADKEMYAQVVYYTNHNDNPQRLHEQINGLYTVGVRHYPIISEFPDAWSEDLNGALANLQAAGFTMQDSIAFQVEMLRRFQPQVVVGHDVNGEYSHGQHILNTNSLQQALTAAADATQFPESAQTYGTWDVPKTYLHLYEENPITVNWDIPLASFGGKTAFQVSQDGYACHDSQQWTWFTAWIHGEDGSITKAAQIETYSPCRFGLYRTNVGLDSGIGDFFEHVTLYSVTDRAASAVSSVSSAEPTPPPVSSAESSAGSSAAESVPSSSAPSARGGTFNGKVIVLLAVMVAVCGGIVAFANRAHPKKHKTRR